MFSALPLRLQIEFNILFYDYRRCRTLIKMPLSLPVLLLDYMCLELFEVLTHIYYANPVIIRLVRHSTVYIAASKS